MTLFTFWALFDDDIRLAGTDQSADLGFEVVISIVFFLFLFEIFAQSLYKEGYWEVPPWAPLPKENIIQTWIRRSMVGSFYFWLDWIATLSLLPEVDSKLQFRISHLCLTNIIFTVSLHGLSEKIEDRPIKQHKLALGLEELFA